MEFFVAIFFIILISNILFFVYKGKTNFYLKLFIGFLLFILLSIFVSIQDTNNLAIIASKVLIYSILHFMFVAIHIYIYHRLKITKYVEFIAVSVFTNLIAIALFGLICKLIIGFI